MEIADARNTRAVTTLRRTALSLVLCAILLAPLAAAHADLVGSTPPANAHLARSPGSIELVWSEAVDGARTRVKVLDPSGANVAGPLTMKSATVGDVTLPARLPDAVYTVTWRALSEIDGHSTNGAYPLLVGNVSASTIPGAVQSTAESGDLGESVGRFAAYAGALLATGVATFSVAVLDPLARAGTARDAADRRIARLALAGGLVLALGSLLALYGFYARAADPNATVTANLSAVATRVGFAWLARILAGLLVALVAWRSKSTPRWAILVAALGVVALLAQAFIGHASGRHAVIGVASDFAHGLAASAWLGGIPALVVTLASGAEPADRIARRFSILAMGSVAVLVGAGTVLTLLLFDRVAELWTTSYGLALLAKWVVLVALVGLGGLNQFVLIPRGAWKSLTRSATFEMGLAVLALVAVVALAIGSPPVSQPSIGPPSVFAADSHGLNVTLSVAPGSPLSPGLHHYEVTLLRATTRAPISNASVNLTFTYLDQDLGSSTNDLASKSDGTYVGDGGEFAFAGSWRVEVKISRPYEFDVFRSFDVTVAQG